MFPQKSILVATDLTKACEPALRAASDLALTSGAALHVLHAFELRGNPYVERPFATSAFQTLVREAEEGLAEQVKLTVAPGVHVQSVTAELFLPWKAIVQRARDVQAELIVLGPHEHVTGDRFLGSTADRVIRFAEVPCLVVRRGRHFDTACVVLAIDGSTATSAAWQEAVSWTSEFARTKNCQFHIVHASPDWVDALAGQELIDGAVRDAEAELADTKAVVIGEVLRGENVDDEIINYADRVDADLLILASAGHGALDRMITGSTTSAVTPRSACPVLIVPVKEVVAEPSANELLRWHLPMALV